LAREINQGFLKAMIELLTESDQFAHVFARLKKTFHDSKKDHYKKTLIIWWYTQLFKNFEEDLIDKHQDIFDNLIDNLDFTQHELTTQIMELVCMLSTKNERYLKEVMEKLIERFHDSRNKNNTPVSPEKMN